jgi:hypothetical protein
MDRRAKVGSHLGSHPTAMTAAGVHQFEAPQSDVIRARAFLVIVLAWSAAVLWAVAATLSPVAAIVLVLFVIFLWFDVRRLVTRPVRLSIGDDGVETITMLARRKFAPWRVLRRAELRQGSVWLGAPQLRLLDDRGHAHVVADASLKDFEQLVLLVRARVPVTDRPGARLLPSLTLTSPAKLVANRGTVRARIPVKSAKEVGPLLVREFHARGFAAQPIRDNRIAASNGWVDVEVRIERGADGDGIVEVATSEGRTPRFLRIISSAATVVALASWTFWLWQSNYGLAVLSIVALQVVGFLLIQRAVGKAVRVAVDTARQRSEHPG